VPDPFEMLGLPRSWRLTVEEIRAAQRRCSIVSHPDRHTDLTSRANAMDESSRINAAASELLDPLSRGSAILNALAPTPRPAEPKQSLEFLMRMMELREAVDAAGQDPQARREIAADVAAELRAIELETDEAMGALLSRPQVETWRAAFDACHRLRAMRRANDECAQ
jgi:DnaJ-domain-containing protein 1